jgi:UDP-2-acetamido-2-deoxy-ribo-hexuluronate aminotransferase
MDSIQCAVVLAKLERFEWEIERRRAIGRRYEQQLGRLEPALRVLPVKADRTSVHAQYTICVPDRDAVQARLKQAGIPTAVHYPVGLHQQPAYAAAHAGESYPISERLAREVLSLPMHADLDELTQDRIIDALQRGLSARAAA